MRAVILSKKTGSLRPSRLMTYIFDPRRRRQPKAARHISSSNLRRDDEVIHVALCKASVKTQRRRKRALGRVCRDVICDARASIDRFRFQSSRPVTLPRVRAYLWRYARGSEESKRRRQKRRQDNEMGREMFDISSDVPSKKRPERDQILHCVSRPLSLCVRLSDKKAPINERPFVQAHRVRETDACQHDGVM